MQLPAGEAVALALHLFTAAVGAHSTREAARQSRLIAQVMELLAGAYGEALRRRIRQRGPFRRHLRYFLVRARTAVQIHDSTASLVTRALRASNPDAYRVACASGTFWSSVWGSMSPMTRRPTSPCTSPG